ncbi:hypothetical protein OKW21_005036 [Catalinimonas alkaloidigena]|uniref:BrxA family protein n=1 Tax=Catalinimonas alkaloidigena TaxID=1075417 RepID=UPI002406AB0A|nr:BrxA family protein [Catalinimonas alkaloidigena]MDF9799773.1 hypothetical protein [Catalinimonas alkaloidigena]
MSDKKKFYTTQLQAGLGLIEETKSLLSIYEPGLTSSQLHEKALESGLFPMVSARRLRNIITECFTPRYIKPDSAKYLKPISQVLPASTFNQFLLVFTSLANQILFDFIIEVYWNKYSGGRDTLSTSNAKDFVTNAVNEGKTQSVWSETTIRRVSSYLIGCCADYGLLSSNRSSERQIQSIRLQEHTLLFFSYWFHLHGMGDNSIINHSIWKIFGLEPGDVREELKRISKKGWLIVQTAGDVTRISWSFNNLEEVTNVIIES